ncbi:nickel ABC transporter, nickel/metallophore periplasmic binding protein [Sarcina sp. JB2]|uniref:Nickel ABC transporter, nickel/metallophore periplasmic binding protein n=1 Tax=Candidatus Sarcina troglodytae TaxID=2726954 RepID=A0ACD1BBY9_9CLOT|nr:nickel ABC transporter substrate-binding protein [Sarcina sp. JB2]QPJ84984.1 nickel ABC transporter, nickel/metallophore periplasmic binding protein [Sarcina sp. JB2]
MVLKNKKLIGIISAFITANMLLVGCGSAESSSMVDDGDEKIVYANYRDIRDLNPHLYNGEMFAQNLLYESLVKIKDDGSISPWLAESYEVSEDGKTYVFKLREDVYFTDGAKFNAEAAKLNFDAILDNYERHSWIESVSLMKEVENSGKESVEVTGEYELTIHLSKSYYPFLVELGVIRPLRFISPNCFIDGTTKNGVTDYIGTGSYYLSEHVTDEYAIFKVNEKYWGDVPDIEEIIVKVIPDSQSRVMALESGEIDLIYGANMIDSETYTKFLNLSEFKTKVSEPISSRVMMINTQDEILGDVRLRKALQYATDRETISKSIFLGIEDPAYTLFSSEVPYADIGLTPYEYNLEKAKELLNEAGWVEVNGQSYRQKDGRELAFTLHYSSDNVTDKTIAEFYKGELAKIGINLEIIGEEAQAYTDRAKSGNFDIIFNESWGKPYDPQSFLASMRESSVHGDYEAQKGLKEKEQIDEAILNALEATTEEERQEYYTYVLETLHEEAVYIPLTYETNRAIYSNKIKNVTFGQSQYEVTFADMTMGE